jgi:hypothetical protein
MPTIDELIDKVKAIFTSARYGLVKDIWRRYESMRETGPIPVCMDMRNSMWGRFLGFDLQSLTEENVAGSVRFQLEQKLFYHERLRDDTLIAPEINVVSYYTPCESRSLFGARRRHIVETEGWRAEPLVVTPGDLDKVRCPRIAYNEGQARMRRDRFLAEVDGALPVRMPGIESFNRGPLDTAVQLRGWQQLMLDLRDRPGFVRDLMERITVSRIEYEERRAKILGLDLSRIEGGLWEDDVNCDVLSPEDYAEFVHPYEVRMARLYGGVTYHSCGNLTPVAGLIADLPNLRQFYFSEPWTDLETVARAVDCRSRIRVDMNPPTSIGVPESALRERMSELAEAGRGSALEVHMASARTGTVEEVLRWVRVGKEVFGRMRA